jgi:transcriptional regulator with XRE-family HTH domain
MVASMFTAASDALASAVVELRKGAGMTQRQLAKAVGREQSYIGRIETGQRRIDLVEWVGICRACGVDPEKTIARLARKVAALVLPPRPARPA